MILKYTFGSPLETDAVIIKTPAQDESLPFFTARENVFSYSMDDDTIVYGLGENVRGINKRGWLYISNCTDDPNHREEKHSLYGAHNFLIIEGKERFGIFIDYPGHLSFDIGYTSKNQITITPENMDLDFYIIQGESDLDIVKQFRHMIGRSYIPPKWAFGYGQSRWSYMNEDEIREVVKNHRDNQIPLDSIYMDIDYMERYKDFTLDNEAFPDFPEFVREMRAQNIHLVPIIDAGVKIEEGYDVYEEGIKNGYFCKEEDGKEFVGAVWPGKVHFPDMLNPDARKWFGRKYQFLLEQGIDGFWNDMNEPAIFYSEAHLDEVFEGMEKFKGKNIDLALYDEFRNLVNGISNNPDDYKRFYHNFHGEMVRHDKVHNLYGFNMTRAAGEAFEELEPQKRILMFSRSSYIGMHRYGGIWTGDNLSWWSHLLLNIRMMPSLNMCGILYTGADLGGFGADTTEDLLLRWLAFGIFTPLMRNHSAMGTRRQEAYRFESLDSFKNIIGIRYRLLPYLYSEFMKAALRDEMYFKPLSFEYPEDSFACRVEDQLLLGGGLMLAPVYEQNAQGRYVYLPESMKMVKMKGLSEMTFEIMEKGHHYVEVSLDEVIFFIRKNHIIPMSKGGQSVEEVDFSHLLLIGYVTEEASYEFYDDDGYGKQYEAPEHMSVIKLDCHNNVTVSSQKTYHFSLSFE